MEFVSILVTAGVTLAEKMLFSWFEQGRSKVKISQLEATIEEMSKREAASVRVREDELRKMTRHLVNELIAESPKMTYGQPHFRGPVLNLDFDPKDPASSKQLLLDLQTRLSKIAEREKANAVPDKPQQAGFEIVPPPSTAGVQRGLPPVQRDKPPGGELSKELLSDLERRIADRENPRQ
jgi:hypothetical protein